MINYHMELDKERLGVTLGQRRVNAQGKPAFEKKQAVCCDCHRIGNMNAHHEDYRKPDEVIWVCDQCHGKRHNTARKKLSLTHYCGNPNS